MLNSKLTPGTQDTILTVMGNLVILNFASYPLTDIVGSSGIVFNIAEGYRPSSTVTAAAVIAGSTGNLYFGLISVTSDGKVVVKTITTYPAQSSVPAATASVSGCLVWTI